MTNTLYNKHIISIPELSREELELIVKTAGELKADQKPELIKNKVIASCFFEPSTRTRLSFETAIQRIGGSVIGFDNGGNTSLAKKGETLSDSVQVISSYVDAFVMRHPQEGAARLASEFSNGVPVINAGDGSNQHPTQTLLDLFSIYETMSVTIAAGLKAGHFGPVFLFLSDTKLNSNSIISTPNHNFLNRNFDAHKLLLLIIVNQYKSQFTERKT